MPSRRAIKHQVREENNLARTLTVKALNSTSSTAATELAGKLRQIPANNAGTDERVTLALLALCFLVLQRGQLGGKNSGRDGLADAGDLH